MTVNNLDAIADKLFNKIKSTTPNCKLGDKDGNVTNKPTDARFFDFDFSDNGKAIGQVTCSLDNEKLADILLIDFEDAVVQKIIQSMLGGQASGVSGVLPGTVQEMIKNAIRDSEFTVKVRDLIADKICEFELKDIPSTLKTVAGGALGSIVDLFS